MKRTPQITLAEVDRATLTRRPRGRSKPVPLMDRAQFVQFAAEGTTSKDIASALGIMPNTAVRRRGRIATGGLAAIE